MSLGRIHRSDAIEIVLGVEGFVNEMGELS